MISHKKSPHQLLAIAIAMAYSANSAAVEYLRDAQLETYYVQPGTRSIELTDAGNITGAAGIVAANGADIVGVGAVGSEPGPYSFIRNYGSIEANSPQGAGIHITDQSIANDAALALSSRDGAAGLEPGMTIRDVTNYGSIRSQHDGIGLYGDVSVGQIINWGTIDVSDTSNGDAAAIFVGEQSTSYGFFISGSLINDSRLSTKPSDERIATVEIRGTTLSTGAEFLTYERVENLDPEGTAIRSYNDTKIRIYGLVAGDIDIRGEMGSLWSGGTINGDINMRSEMQPIGTRGAKDQQGDQSDDFYGYRHHADVVNAGTVNGHTRMNGGVFSSYGGTSGPIEGADDIVFNYNPSTGEAKPKSTINGEWRYTGTLNFDIESTYRDRAHRNFTPIPIDLTAAPSISQLEVTGSADLSNASVYIYRPKTPDSRDEWDEAIAFEGDEVLLIEATDLTSDITYIDTNSTFMRYRPVLRDNNLFAVIEHRKTLINNTVLELDDNDASTGAVIDALYNQQWLLEEGDELTSIVEHMTQLSKALERNPTDNGELLGALRSLQPQANNATRAAASTAESAVADTISQRLSNLRSDAERGRTSNQGFWVQYYDHSGEQDSVAGVDGFDADTSGLALGFDLAVGQRSQLGLALSQTNTDIASSAARLSNSSEVEGNQLSLYGSYQAEGYYLDAQLAYAQLKYQGRRQIVTGLQASNEHKADQYSLRLGASRPVSFDLGLEAKTQLTQKLALNYRKLNEEAYDETGAGSAGLHIGDIKTDALVMAAGAELSQSFELGTYTLIPEFHATLEYDLLGEQTEIHANFLLADDLASQLPSTQFVTKSAELEPLTLQSGLGLQLFNDSQLSFYLRYDYRYRKDYTGQSYSAALRYDF